MTKRIRVGIIGANRGWAAQAHIPYLSRMPRDIDVVGVWHGTTYPAPELDCLS